MVRKGANRLLFQQHHCDLVYIGYASICHSVCLWCQRQKVYVCQYKTIPTLYMRTYLTLSRQVRHWLSLLVLSEELQPSKVSDVWLPCFFPIGLCYAVYTVPLSCKLSRNRDWHCFIHCCVIFTFNVMIMASWLTVECIILQGRREEGSELVSE